MSDDLEQEAPLVPDEDVSIEPRMKQVGGSISSPNDIDESLAQLIDKNEGNIVHEPTCLICSSPHRVEIESEWENNKSYAKVREFIQTKTGMDVSKGVIENHMIYHLSREIKEIQKGEYANKIRRLTSVPLSSMDLLNLGKAALQERLMGVNSLTPGGDMGIADIEKIKTQETTRITASITQLLKMQESLLSDMRKNGDILSIPREPFMRIFRQALLNAKTDEVRDLIDDLLDQIGDLSKIAQ